MKVRRGYVVALLCVGAVTMFMILKNQKQIDVGIVQAPDPILHQVSAAVDNIDEEALQIASELTDVLAKLDHPLNIFGLGMAAPQIGYSKRVIGLKRAYGDYQIMINPEVVEAKWSVPWISTCFSLKGLHVLKRNLWMRVRYTDLDGSEKEEIFRGGRATVLQQEIDHINGILVSDV